MRLLLIPKRILYCIAALNNSKPVPHFARKLSILVVVKQACVIIRKDNLGKTPGWTGREQMVSIQLFGWVSQSIVLVCMMISLSPNHCIAALLNNSKLVSKYLTRDWPFWCQSSKQVPTPIQLSKSFAIFACVWRQQTWVVGCSFFHNLFVIYCLDACIVC